ncbi:hypothetical protein ACXYRR_01235 [Mycoplasma sp. 246B]
MKKIKKLLISSVFVSAGVSAITIACGNPETKNQQSFDGKVETVNVNNNSAVIKIKLFKTYKATDISLHLSKPTQYDMPNISILSNILTVTFENIKADTQYQIDQIFANGNELKFSDSDKAKLQFKTPKNQQDVKTDANIISVDSDSTTATITLKLTNKNLDASKLSATLNPTAPASITSKDDVITIKYTNLTPNTDYNLSQLNIDDTVLKLSNNDQNKLFFHTASISTDPQITQLSLSDDNSKLYVKLANVDASMFANEAKIKFKNIARTLTSKLYDANTHLLTFDISSITKPDNNKLGISYLEIASTQYHSNLTVTFNASNNSETTPMNPITPPDNQPGGENQGGQGDSQTSQGGSNSEPQNPSNPSEQNPSDENAPGNQNPSTTNPDENSKPVEKPRPTKDEFTINSIDVTDISKTSASLRISFTSNSRLHDANVHTFDASLSNSKSLQVTNYTEGNNLYLNFANLSANTTYQLISLKLNNVALNLPNINPTFKTLDINAKTFVSDNFKKVFNDGHVFGMYSKDLINVNTYTNTTDSEIKADNSLTKYFSFIDGSDYKHVDKDVLTPPQTTQIIKSTIADNTIKLEIKTVNLANNTSLTLKYKKASKDSLDSASESTVSGTVNNNLVTFTISNLTTNDFVKITGLSIGSTAINHFSGLNTIYENKNYTSESSAFSFSSENNFQAKRDSKGGVFLEFTAAKKSDSSNVDFPQYFIKYKDNNTFNYKQFGRSAIDGLPNVKKYNVYLPPNEAHIFDNYVDLVLQKNTGGDSKYYDVKGFPGFNNSSGTLTNNYKNPVLDILSSKVENNKVVVTYSQTLNDTISSIKFLVKNLNPFDPYSKLIDATVDKNKKTASFDTSVLPKNISKYIITAAQVGDEQTGFSFLDKYKFSTSVSTKTFNLSKFTTYLDESNKKLYGSAKFDFADEDLKLFKNKWIVFELNPEIKTESTEAYGYVLPPTLKLIVPFEKLWKFQISGYFENAKYTISKIYATEKQRMDMYYDKFSIPANVEKSFRYHFNYSSNGSSPYLLTDNSENTMTTTYSDNDLITQNKNLTVDDLIGYWMKDETKNKIPYSLQNHFALVEYERMWKYRKLEDDSTKEKKNFILVDDSGKQLDFFFFTPREILSHTIFNFGNNHHSISIEKDLDEYKNWESFKDDVYFTFRFELENTKIIMSKTNRNSSVPVPRGLLSFVNVSVSFKELLAKHTINDATFTITPRNEDALFNQTLFAMMKDRYSFKVTYDESSKKLKLEVIPKHSDIYFTDILSEHILANKSSAFVGNVFLTMNYVDDKNNPTKNPTYQGKPLKDSMSVSLTETIQSRPQAQEEAKTVASYDKFQQTSKLKSEDGIVQRLYSDDTFNVLTDVRRRTFAFDYHGRGTWGLFNKVKPDDASDHRYYIVSNSHNIDLLDDANASWVRNGQSLDGLDIERRTRNNILSPIFIKKPTDTADNMQKKQPILEGHGLGQNMISNLSIEIVSHFFANGKDIQDSYKDPYFKDFRDNYGNELKTGEKYSDVDVAIIDISWFENNFAGKNIDDSNFTFQGQKLTDDQKRIIKFFLDWKNAKPIKISNELLHQNAYNNLNWIVGSMPGQNSKNPDSPTGTGQARFREYLLGNFRYQGKISSVGSLNHQNDTIVYGWNSVDLAAGSSGSNVFDSQGNLAGLVTQDQYGATANEGTASIMLLDGQRIGYIGNGHHPQNPYSFYEKIRLLSYLFPERYGAKNFSEQPADLF